MILNGGHHPQVGVMSERPQGTSAPDLAHSCGWEPCHQSVDRPLAQLAVPGMNREIRHLVAMSLDRVYKKPYTREPP